MYQNGSWPARSSAVVRRTKAGCRLHAKVPPGDSKEILAKFFSVRLAAYDKTQEEFRSNLFEYIKDTFHLSADYQRETALQILEIIMDTETSPEEAEPQTPPPPVSDREFREALRRGQAT